MKRFPFILLLVAFILTGSSKASANLLQNPGFEEAGWPPSSWFEWAGSSSGSYDDGVAGYLTTAVSYKGTQCAARKLYGSNYRWGGYTQDVAVSGGKSITASAWLMSSSSDDPLANGAEAYIELKFLNGNNNELATYKSTPLTGASLWVQHTISQVAPSNAVKARFSFILVVTSPASTGTVYFDDAVIEGEDLFAASVSDVTDSSAIINFSTSSPEIAEIEYRGSCAELFDPDFYPLPSSDYIRGIIYDPNDSPYPDTFVSDFPEISPYFNCINIYGQEYFGHDIFDELDRNGLKLVFRVETYNKEVNPPLVGVDDFNSFSRYAYEAKNDIGYWTGGGNLGDGGYHTVTGEGALKIHWTAGTGWWVTVLKDSAPYFDAASYYSISFDVKSDDGGEFIYVGLEDSNGQKGMISIDGYMPNGLLTSWSHIEIPLITFTYANPQLDMTRIKSFIFSFWGNSGGTMYVDDIFIDGKMVFDYTQQDADWAIEHYRDSLTYVTTNYPDQIIYYEINMPLDNEKLKLPSLEKQKDHVSYLAGRIKNEFDSTKPIYVNFYHGYKDELIQEPAQYMSDTDGISLVVYPMHFDISIYGDGIPEDGPHYVPTYDDHDWMLLMKDQLDYYIDKTIVEDGNRPIYIDQIGYASEFYRPWRFDLNGRVEDNRAKYTSIIATRDYLESLWPDVKGWFYFLYYNNNWEASWGVIDQKKLWEESPKTTHSVGLTNLFPDTEYTYTIRTPNATHQDTFTTNELTGMESNPLPLITVTNPPYGNTKVDSEGKIEIRWKDSDSRGDATVNLYWDTNDRDFMSDKPYYAPANNFIASFSENDPTNKYVWDTTGMPAGSYYIYAILENGGANTEVPDYSSGQVILSSESINAYKTEDEITVDGNPNDLTWQDIPWYTFAAHPSQNMNSAASVKALWGFESLYLLFKVEDTQVETASGAPWDEDSIHFIINNGSSANETFLGVSGGGTGSVYNALSLMGGTTVDNNADTDQGYYIEMKVKWLDLTRIMPSIGDIIPIDLISIDHDGNPGAVWTDCTFSKISFDGDSSIDTTGKSIILKDSQ